MDRVIDLLRLPLRVEGCELEPRELEVSPSWTRRTTVVRLHGEGLVGSGEDVTYQGEEQLAFLDPRPVLDLAGTSTVEGFSRRLDQAALFPAPPQDPKAPLFRRWAFEAAALDLALRQANISLAAALDREPRPVRFVVSMGLGDPPDPTPVRRLLAMFPQLELKLDPTPAWNDELVDELVSTGAVRVIDLKGQYKKGPFRGTDAAPGFYRRMVEAFQDAWIEDPDLEGEPGRILEPHLGRVTWDAPICSLSDILVLSPEPRALNIKPSRFGRVAELFRVYDYCAARGIAVYGGGQLELGSGRGQIQALASLFHPDAPNDAAPSRFNAPEPPTDLPGSPLAPQLDPTGFGWSG